jgi:hypothetical protein
MILIDELMVAVQNGTRCQTDSKIKEQVDLQ